MNTRWLGVVCIAGSLVLFLDNARRMVTTNGESAGVDSVFLITNTLWSLGGIAGLLGLIRLNVLGANPVVRALGFVPIIGFALLILSNLFQAAGVYPTASENTLAGIGWVVEMAGMVLVGILAIAAKTWRGWRRFVPLFAVVSAPLAFALGNFIGNDALAFLPFYAIWMLLGYLVAVAFPAAAPANLATS